MGTAPNHKSIRFKKPDWSIHQDKFQKQNKLCQKQFPECPKDEGKYCENCPFK